MFGVSLCLLDGAQALPTPCDLLTLVLGSLSNIDARFVEWLVGNASGPTSLLVAGLLGLLLAELHPIEGTDGHQFTLFGLRVY